MEIRATVENHDAVHRVTVGTDGRTTTLSVSPKSEGRGSAVNGGEFLCLALATCYCNDIYREAARRGLTVTGVTVQVESEFGAAGEPARRIRYTARVESDASPAEVEALLRHTDTVAEIQNTLRRGLPIEFALPGPLEGEP